MKKKIIAMVIMVAMMVSQLFVPAVFADRDDLAQVVNELNSMSDTNKGLLLSRLWDVVDDNINNDNITANEAYLLLIESFDDLIGEDGKPIIPEDFISESPEEGKISRSSVIMLIEKTLDHRYRAIIKDIYEEYKPIITKPIVKDVLGLEQTATPGTVFVNLTQMSVPVLALNGEDFVINGDVAAGISIKLGEKLAQLDATELNELIGKVVPGDNTTIEVIKELLNDVLEGLNKKDLVDFIAKLIYPILTANSKDTDIDMNGRIKKLADKINEKIPFNGVTSDDIIDVLNLYKLYEKSPNEPIINSLIPGDGATGVSTGIAIKITYDKNIYSDIKTKDINSLSSITLKNGSTTVETKAAISGNVLTITPKSSLANSTTYTVNIPAGAVASEVMRPAAEKTFTFTTASSGGSGAPSSGGDTTPTTPTKPKEEDKGTGIVVETTKNNGEVVVKVVIGKAEEGKLVDKATEEEIKKIVSEAKQKNEEPILVIDAKTEDNSSTSASIEVPSNLILAAVEAGVAKIEIATDVAAFLIPIDAIELTADSVVKFNTKKLDSAELTEEVKKSVGDAPVFDLSITVDDVRVENFKNKVRISIPYELKEGEDPEKVTVFYINEEGKLENVIGKYNVDTNSVEFDTNHLSLYAVKVNNVTFSDVESEFWASKYIEVMASKGVIKGVGDGSKFAPNNNVTRAEFAAMIVREFKLFDESAPNNFKDVSEKDWFYPEVTAAAKIGLVQGRPGGIFAPNDSITREEMAKMLSNALTLLLGKDIPEDKEELLKSFKDNGQIADYARDAVAIGVKYEIFAGRPNGTFAPKDNANRAEASKLIYMLFYLE